MTLSEEISKKSQEISTGWEPPPLTSQPMHPAAIPATATAAAPAQPSAQEQGERARKQGYDAGYAEGVAAGRDDAKALTQEVEALIDAFAAPFAESDATLTRQVLELTERITRAVLKRELHTDSSAIEAVVTEALAVLADGSSRIELSINPADAALCRDLGMSIRGNVVLVENSQLHRGGVELRSGSRLVDASIETRLQSVLESLYVDAGLPAPEPSSSAAIVGDA